jgi:hypothetical protein
MTAHPNEVFLFVGHSGVFDALHEHLLGPRSGRESSNAVPYLANPTVTGCELTPVGSLSDLIAGNGASPQVPISERG